MLGVEQTALDALRWRWWYSARRVGVEKSSCEGAIRSATDVEATHEHLQQEHGQCEVELVREGCGLGEADSAGPDVHGARRGADELAGALAEGEQHPHIPASTQNPWTAGRATLRQYGSCSNGNGLAVTALRVAGC